MFSKDFQYVNMLKYDNQLKVDYKILKNENLDKTEESTYIIYDEILSKDIALKINQWQKNIPKTYLATLCLCDDEKIINKTNKKLLDYKKAYLNNSFDVVVKTSKLFEVQHYFELTGLDYVYSPFQVLNLHLEQNPTSNSLIVLTISNYVYILIVNELNRIVFNKIHKVSDFNDIKESKFYENDLTGQKLYDEVYLLELQDSISKTLQEYYDKKNDTFIEKIDILYTIKQLNDDQIQQLEDDLLINVHYHYISLKDSLYELARSVNNTKQSYIKPRIKKSSPAKKWFWSMFILFSILVGIGYIYKEEVSKYFKSIEKELLVKKEPIKEAVKEIILLPNHKVKNNIIEKEITELFSIIPYDMLINSLEIKKDNSVISGKMLTPDSYIKDIQPKLLKLYKYSNIQVKDSKNIALDVTIYNSDKISDKTKDSKKGLNYLSDGFMPVKRVSDNLKIILPKSAVLKYENSFKMDISTFNYRVNVIVESPQKFFDLISNLNKELYSIEISYPIVFLRNQDNNIEIDFGLQFHQNL